MWTLVEYWWGGRYFSDKLRQNDTLFYQLNSFCKYTLFQPYQFSARKINSVAYSDHVSVWDPSNTQGIEYNKYLVNHLNYLANDYKIEHLHDNCQKSQGGVWVPCYAVHSTTTLQSLDTSPCAHFPKLYDFVITS